MEPYVKDTRVQRQRMLFESYNSTTTSTSNWTKHQYLHGGELNGFKNPNWKDQVKRQVQAGTQLDATSFTVHDRPISVTESRIPDNPSVATYYPATVHVFGNHTLNVASWMSSFPTSLVAEADNLALTRFLSDMRTAAHSFQGGEMVGELGQAVRLLSSPGKSIVKGMRGYIKEVTKLSRAPSLRLQRLNRTRRSERLNSLISDAWLTYSLGAKPLFNDIADAVDVIRSKSYSDRIYGMSARGFGEANYNTPRGLNSASYCPFVSGWQIGNGYKVARAKYQVRQFHSAKVIYRGHVGAGVSVGTDYALRQVGLDITSFVPTLWELIPYSFVIDYFANVGQIISGLCFPRRLVDWSMRTVIEESKVEFSEWESNLGTFYVPVSGGRSYTIYRTGSLGNVVGIRRTVTRAPYNGSFVPDLDFRIPGRGTSWLNMAALVTAGKLGTQHLRKLIN